MGRVCSCSPLNAGTALPELPEVETVVRAIRPRLLGRTICGVEVRWPNQARPDLQTVQQRPVGRRIESVLRRGKLIVLQLGPGCALSVHLRMTGRLQVLEKGAVEPAYSRAVLHLDDGSMLVFTDARKFGRLTVGPSVAALTQGLGPEPLSRRFSAAWLGAQLGRRRRAIKPLLLDQSFIAGMGNIYTDEALFKTGVHPLRPACELSEEEVKRLHRAMRSLLRRAIECCGTSFDWGYEGGHMQSLLQVYGRKGLPCKRCKAPITRMLVGQRGTHVCEGCQG
jgi:formamidopyrimidine-DNA glycosylase